MEEWREVSPALRHVQLSPFDLFIPHPKESGLCTLHLITKALMRERDGDRGER
jgi:hypothetical protein